MNTLNPNSSVREAIACLESAPEKYVCIVGDEQRFLGLFTQGDMRRYLLAGGGLSDSICRAMNSNPQVFRSCDEAVEASSSLPLSVYPVVDDAGRLSDCFCKGDPVYAAMREHPLRDTPLVIMAGGKGTRLYPYTKVLPKALVPIGEKTIIERVIDGFAAWGCREVYIIVKHKARMIKAYFDDLETDYAVHFIEEREFLGTGGGLALLKGMVRAPFFLSNCDILVNADYDCVMKTHRANGDLITFVAAMKDVEVPYGVIVTRPDGSASSLQEKPRYSFLTNTGVYYIDPQVIEELPCNTFMHITDIAQHYIDEDRRVGVFPVSKKSWLDMGQMKEMSHMLKELGVDE